jgi:hypothetical protein
MDDSPLPVTLNEIHIQPCDSSDFGSCCSDDDSPNASPKTHYTEPAVLSPLPFVLELPEHAKTVPQNEIPSPLKQAYSIRSCSEEEIPTIEAIADRTVGTFGFLAGLTVYVGLCCCAFNSRAGEEIAETYQKHTLFAWCWPLK